MPIITKEYYEVLKNFSDSFLFFISKLQNDEQLRVFLKKKEIDSTELFTGGFALDVLKWFSMIADINDLNSKESFSVIFLLGRKVNLKILNDFNSIKIIYETNIISNYERLRNNLKHQINIADNSFIATLMEGYDSSLRTEYLTNLYRFVSIVVKADGKVSKEEEEALKNILIISEGKKNVVSSIEVQRDDVSNIGIQPKAQSLNQALEELNTLIGLNEVKREINSLINYLKIQKARESNGLKTSAISYHIVFTGNPGTGKTTVARIISEIFMNLGILRDGHIIETDRSGMVAEYVGQTAIKVNKIVTSAINGILFIDEAYSLIGENNDDFGKEAVSTLIKQMEDNRNKLVVILAGYTSEMQKFINSNPGLKSRFNRYIEFVDYNPDELIAIFKLQCKKLDYKLTEDAESKFYELFNSAFISRDKSFGNGRFVRNIFEKTLEQQANRVASIPVLTREILTTITVVDVPLNNVK